MDTFVKAGERGLKARAEDGQATHEAEVRELRAKIGELVLQLDARKKLAALSETRDRLLTVQGTMRAEGKEVSSRSCAAGLACRALRSTIAGSGRVRRARPGVGWSWSVGSSLHSVIGDVPG